ncbi:MAG TPA: putative baseplate assembly protein [Armatimonadota bacterium]|jgi:predicted phage baseplate assembly protein
MPLKSYLPQIDDRRFDDIMAEVRTRIARYTPEWTDVNDNDPGIAMVQVFAWLSDMLLFRMGQVPELNYLKFLELVGIELRPAGPAQAEISFPVVAGYPQASLIVPSRTQVAADSPEGGPPVVFETDRALIALTARLASVQAFDGYSYTDVSAVSQEARAGFLPFGQLAADGSALLLGFDHPSDFPAATEVNLAVFAFQDTARTAAFQCGLPVSPAYGPARLLWEYWDGVEWKSLSLLKDETRALTRSGHIYLKTPVAKGAMQRVALGEVADPRYWIRARVDRSQYERAPRLLAVRTNTVSAVQAETIQDEVLGGSNGRPDQTFQLENTPVLPGSLRLEVDEGSGPEVWTAVEDLFGAGPDDPQYVLDRTSGEIRFGDGVNGRIPVANVNNAVGNVIAREYRFGGGKAGNVPAMALKTVVTPVTGVDDSGVGNLLAAYGGQEEETLEEAKKRAPHALRSRCRAVTAEDFEFMATQVAGIKRARALPLFHPDFPDVKVPGVVTVIIVPDADAQTPNPTPSEGTIRTVCAYLDQRRLLTTELYVVKPDYQQVEVRGEVVAADDADLAEVSQGIEGALLNYFHPLRGGEDGQGWPFGGTIFYSRVYQQVFSVPGVQSITSLVVLLDGRESPACTDVPIRPGALLYSTQHSVQVGYSFEGA